ncbi:MULTISPECIES: hypothetical protein [Pseudomonas]|uniref:hypothetical protein n=1 Tax=Pseudomonas TaxID=286 RepID=UPI0003C0699A|nr:MULTISPECIES: hypothetical protein [Pseudomonas]AGZ36275.1 hypothetical protein PVLB_17470 [Pseudomonas sp. VLB120]MDT8924433.1 hypothetical protein [Pseudomonas taiwanensis]WEZ87328.1 hypothetical protein P3R38_17725 [Pseudomonas sp. NyZ480]
MLITSNGLGWQANIQQQRVSNEQALAEVVQTRPPVTTSNTSAQQNSQGNTAQQNAEDAREEAFAKLKVLLQNPDIAARQQASINSQDTSNALQEFREYMAKTPEEKVQEKVLAELGLTVEEFEALPPEQKQKIGEQIAQRIKEDIEMNTQAKVQQQALSEARAQVGADVATSQSAQDREKALEAMEV